MNIGIIGDTGKKQLVKNMCVAYSHIFKKHELYAPAGTGQLIESVTNLKVNKLKTGALSMLNDLEVLIEQQSIDALFYLVDPDDMGDNYKVYNKLFRKCDLYSVPFATNLGTAEILIQGIDRGDLAWRELYH